MDQKHPRYARLPILRWLSLAIALLLFAAPLVAQTAGRIVGQVVDPTGAVIVGADVTAVDQATNATKTVKSGSDGHFVILDEPAGLYKLTVKAKGFTTAVYPDIKVDIARTSEITAQLAVGSTGSEVVVEAAGEVLQTQSSAVEGTVQGSVLRTLPLNNRNALDFVMLMPGAQQGGTVRQSTFNGLPHGGLSISMDGQNVQDNLLKSSSGGGMFTLIQPKMDAVEEVTVTSATPGAQASADGAVNIKFETRRGGNDWHGSVYEYYRDQGLNANTFFNNRQTDNGKTTGNPKPLRRTKNHLNQYGFAIGGPVIKNKLFVFGNFEDFRLPAGQTRTDTLLNANAQQGLFAYSGGTANLFAIAAANQAKCAGAVCQTTINPVIAQELAMENQLASGAPLSTLDLWRNQIRWSSNSPQRRYFDNARIDWDINQKMRWHATGNWDHFDSKPDALNSYDQPYPNSTLFAGQYSRRWQASTTFDWTLSPTMNYEFNVGRNSSIVRFFPEANLAAYPNGYGYRFGSTLGITPSNGTPGGTSSRTLGQGRDTPVLTFNNTLGWVKGRHTMNFGNVTEIITAYAYYLAPGPLAGEPGGGLAAYTISMAGDDPAASMFSTTTMPGASTTDLTNARALYAFLTGRVSSIRADLAVSENSHAYNNDPLNERDRQNVLSFFATDSFRATKNLTLNYGLRAEHQGAPYNRNNIYTSVGYAGVWGVSGVGNLFKPGTLTGSSPVLTQQSKGFYSPGIQWDPSVGFAWSPDTSDSGISKWLTGGPGKTVLRGSYSIASVREGLNGYLSVNASNPGLTQSATWSGGVSGVNSGNVFLGGPVPALATFPKSYSFPENFSDFAFSGSSVNADDPNLKIGYVQSYMFGLQRELNKDTVLEVRYVGNHGTKLWKQVNIDEVNVFENGFLNEFMLAQQNYNACGGSTFDPAASCSPNKSLPIMAAAFGNANSAGSKLSAGSSWANGTFLTDLATGQAGAMANVISGNSNASPTYLCRLVGNSLTGCANLGFNTKGAYPANFFQVNPDAAGGGAFLMTNMGMSKYDSLQVELRRRMAKGLMMNLAYTYSNARTNKFDDSSVSASNFTTLRDPRLDWGPSPWDLRHTFRAFFVYQLPFGPGRHWNPSSAALGKVIGGWELSGVLALQDGRIVKLTSGRATVNQNDSGVVFSGITADQFNTMQEVVKNYLGTACDSVNNVYYLNPSLIDPAAGCTAKLSQINNPTTPGKFGTYHWFRGPNFVKPDLTLSKHTKITERVDTEFRAEVFNAFNYQNFMIGAPGTVPQTVSINSTSFGRTNQFFNDAQGNQDPGARMVQLVLRVTF